MVESDASRVYIKSWAHNVCWVAGSLAGLLALALCLLWIISIDTCLGEISERLSGGGPPEESGAVGAITPGTGVDDTAADAGVRWQFDYSPTLETYFIAKSLRDSPFALLYRIDLSTITTFLLFSFTAYIAYGAFAVALGRWKSALSSTFPFRSNAVVHWVQLGLVGTLFGFLLLGFGLREMQSKNMEETISLLVAAFGTALLSTFTGVVLAYIAAPPVQRLFARCFTVSSDERTEQESSLEFVDWMNKMVASLQGLNQVIEANRGALIESLEAVTQKVEESAQSIERCFNAPEGAMTNLADVAERTRAGVTRALSDLKTAVDNTRIAVGRTTNAIQEIKPGIEGAQARAESTKVELVTSINESIDEVAGRIDAAAGKIESLESILANLHMSVNLQGEDGSRQHADTIAEMKEERAAIDLLTDEIRGLRAALGDVKNRAASKGDPAANAAREQAAALFAPRVTLSQDGESAQRAKSSSLGILKRIFKRNRRP